MSQTGACGHSAHSICLDDSRDWAVTVVFNALQNTWRSNVLTEVVGSVCGKSEVAVNK